MYRRVLGILMAGLILPVLIFSAGCNRARRQAVMCQVNDPSQMMSYIIRTKEGKLIIIDGGYARDAVDLVGMARKITGDKIPVVDAWFFTHCHSDHVEAFAELIKNKSDQLKVKHIYYNFPSKEFVKTYGGGAYDTYVNFMEAAESFAGAQRTVVQQGDSFLVGDVQIEVLLTPDETITSNAINESSVVYRVTIEKQRILFLGDLGVVSGRRLQETCPDLSCELVQMAHHGSNGVQFELYNLMHAKACLWPTPKWLWENNQGSGYDSGPWETIRLYEHMKSLGVEHHYICKDGVQELVFPIEF